MYRIVLACNGIPAHARTSAARDITEEFTRRPWNKNVLCKWHGTQLILQADSDVDSYGLALLDEFSDVMSACIRTVAMAISTLCPSLFSPTMLRIAVLMERNFSWSSVAFSPVPWMARDPLPFLL